MTYYQGVWACSIPWAAAAIGGGVPIHLTQGLLEAFHLEDSINSPARVEAFVRIQSRSRVETYPKTAPLINTAKDVNRVQLNTNPFTAPMDTWLHALLSQQTTITCMQHMDRGRGSAHVQHSELPYEWMHNWTWTNLQHNTTSQWKSTPRQSGDPT